MGDDLQVRELIERNRIADVINTVFVATDVREWDRVRTCFGPLVLFDMASVGGGEATRTAPETIVAGWQAGLAPIAAVHHQIGNLSIELRNGYAEASCYGIAYHYRRTRSGRNTRCFVGSYDFRLRKDEDRWQIDLFRFNLKFIDGNLELEKEPGA